MTKTLSIAFKKAAGLPKNTQEYIGQAVLNRINAIERLREQIAVGMRSVDAGRVSKLDIDAFLKEIRARHGKK
jgi:hypothetical protein